MDKSTLTLLGVSLSLFRGGDTLTRDRSGVSGALVLVFAGGLCAMMVVGRLSTVVTRTGIC